MSLGRIQLGNFIPFFTFRAYEYGLSVAVAVVAAFLAQFKSKFTKQ